MIEFVLIAAIPFLAAIIASTKWRSRKDRSGQMSQAEGSTLVDATTAQSDHNRAAMAHRRATFSTVPAIMHRDAGRLSDAGAVYNLFSDKVGAILGYSREELESDPAVLVRQMHPDDRRRYYSCEDHLIVAQSRTRLEHRFKNKSGEYRWIRRNISRVEDKDGKFRELVGWAIDVTDLKESDARLQNFIECEAYARQFEPIRHCDQFDENSEGAADGPSTNGWMRTQ